MGKAWERTKSDERNWKVNREVQGQNSRVDEVQNKKRSCMEVPYSFMTCPGIEPGFTP